MALKSRSLVRTRSKTIISRDTRSRDKSKTLNLYCHNIYANQTWQGVDIERGASTYKVT